MSKSQKVEEKDVQQKSRYLKPFGIQYGYALEYRVNESKSGKYNLTILLTDGSEGNKEKELPSGETTSKIFFYTPLFVYKDANQDNNDIYTTMKLMAERLHFLDEFIEQIDNAEGTSYIDDLDTFGKLIKNVGSFYIRLSAQEYNGNWNPQMSTIPVTINKQKIGVPQVCHTKDVIKGSWKVEEWKDNNGYDSEVITKLKFKIGDSVKDLTASKQYDIPQSSEEDYDDDAFGGNESDDDAEGVF